MTKAEIPLVSVICLCYNHSKYVVAAIESVLSQTYTNVELIIVDDASTDNSQLIISNYIKEVPQIKFIPLRNNVGNCSAFNIGWQASSGKFIIDLAADDLLLPERISVGVNCFFNSGSEYGVHFSDAQIIDKESNIIGEHITNKYFKEKVPEGYLFKTLLEKYFINPVTMMYSGTMLDYLGGYDESLVYEDFDLWVRSSKRFKYCYTKEKLVAKRVLNKSHGRKQYWPGSKILKSTLLVCKKAYDICDSAQEFEALVVRIEYEMKMAFLSFNWAIALSFFNLKKQTQNKINVRES